MGKKKTFLVDNSPVDVEEQDVKDFLKYNKSAIEARSYIVGKDTVDVALTDVADFEANVKDAKPLYGEEPKQTDPYAPKPVNFGTTTSVSPIIPEKPQPVTNDQKNRAKNYGDVVGQIKNMQGELTTIKNREDADIENSSIFLSAESDKRKAELEKNIALYNKAISTNVAQHTKDLYAKWDKEIPDITPYTTTASTGGVTVHDTEKTFAEADKLAKEYGQEGTDFNTFVKLAFSQYVENRISQPIIEKYANEAFMKLNNTDKSIPETAQEDFEQGFKEKGAIIGKANAELTVVANAVKAEYAPEKEQLKQDASHISEDFWKDTQQYEMDYTASQWQLNNDYQQGKLNQEQYKAASDQAYNAYKAEFEQRQKESIETGALLAKTERDINLKIQRTYNQRRDMLLRGYDATLQEAAKKYSAKYKASPEFEANVNKAYSIAYDRYNKEREGALKQDMDVKGVVGMGTNTAWAMKNFGLAVSESVGNSIRSYGVMWNNAAMMKIGDEMATNIELPESKIRTDQIMSDLLSYRGLLTAGQITGSGLPGIAVGVASAAVGNVAGVSEGLTAAVGGVIAWGQETNDMAASMYAETMAATGNAATASEKAKQIVKGQTVMLIPSVLHITSFMKGINFGIKNKALSYATKVTGEMAKNIFEENYQNPMEEAVRKKGDWTMLGEYITKEGIVETTSNVLPIFGQALATTQAEGESKGVDIKAQAAKYISDNKLAEILANRGDSFAQKELYDTQRVMGDNFALATVQQMYTQGLIDDKQLNTLTAAVATNNQITQQIEALKLNPEQGLMYRALVHKQTEAANNMASATSDVEKNYFTTQEQNVSAQLKLLAEGKDADVVMLTMPNGSQQILTTAEANQMFTDPDFIEQIKQGKSVDIKSYGKAVEGIKDSLKKLEGIIQSEKAAAATSANQTEQAAVSEETTSDNQTATKPQTAEERAAAVLARVKRAPQTEKQKLEEELKTATDQEVRTNIGQQITLHETKAQHEQKLKDIDNNIANLSENGKVVENLAKINALAAEKTKTEESISDINKQLKTKADEKGNIEAQKGRQKNVLNKGWHDLEEADRITVGGVGAKVDGVNKNLNGSVFSINYTLDDGTKGAARISGQDIVDENGKPVLLKMEDVANQSETKPETKPTSDKEKPISKPEEKKTDKTETTSGDNAIRSEKPTQEVKAEPSSVSGKEVGSGVGGQHTSAQEAEPKKADIERRKQELEKKYEETKERHLRELEKAGVDLGKWGIAFNDIIHNIEEENNSGNYSKEVEALARKQYEEWWALNREKQEIESDADRLSFSDYNFSNKQSILDRLKKALSKVYQTNRQALDDGFVEWANVEREVASVGGNQYAAHGMGKTTIASAFSDLINLFEKGINPFRGQGALDVATLAGGISDGTTAGGAYMNGAFTLVANRNHNGRIENINQIGGIIVNEGIATPEVLSALKELFPNLVIESTLNSKSLVEQLNAKYDAELKALEQRPQETVIGETVQEPTKGKAKPTVLGKEVGGVGGDVDITKPKVGKYDGDTDFEIRTTDELNVDDVLKRDKPIKLYPEQIVPINPPYSDKAAYWVAPKDIVINEGYGSIDISKGDKIYISVSNPQNGGAESSTSYKVWIKNRSYPLSHFIPETAEHGTLDESKYFDAVTQMKNFDKVISGELETPQKAKEERIKIAEKLIPNKDFYVSKPYNSKSGFEHPKKIVYKNGKYLRLRDDHWVTKSEYEKETQSKQPNFNENEYNIWGEYNDKNALAWDIVNNARLIHSELTPKEDLSKLWDKQYDYLTSENKKRYREQSISTQEVKAEQPTVPQKESAGKEVGSGVGGDVENTAKALEEVAKTKPTLWEKIKGAVKNVGKKLGIISNAEHINNFNTAKAEWDKLSSREKRLKRADYELDDLHHTEGGYYKVGNSLIDLDLNSNHLKLLLENNKFLNVLNKLGVTKIHGENRPTEEMFAHYSDGKIHLNNNSTFENIRQVTNAMSHELGHHEWTKLTKEERDYVRSLPLETGMAKHYEAQEKSGKGKETSASLQEENFADYVMQYFQGKLYGDEALLNKIPTKLRELFDNKYSDLLKGNEHSEIAEAYHKAKADGSNPELVKAVEQSLPTQAHTTSDSNVIRSEDKGEGASDNVIQSENEGNKIIAEAEDIKKHYDEFIKKNKKYISNGKIKDTMPKSIREEAIALQKEINRVQSTLYENLRKLSEQNRENRKNESEQTSKQFDIRQKELQKSYNLTVEDIIIANIEMKDMFSLPLSKEEIDYANENFYIPKGFHYTKKGIEKKPTKKAHNDGFDKAADATNNNVIQSEKAGGSGVGGDVKQQELDAEKVNKEAGVDIYAARQGVEVNGEKYTLSQIKENGNTNTFLIEDANGNEVGKAQLSADGNYLENIRIDEKHRRKGLASKVYDFIELRKGVELEPSPNKQSKEAKALWDKRNLQKSVSNKANGGLLAKALGESMSKAFADYKNKQQVLLELENKYFEQKGLSKEYFNKLSETEKAEIIKDAVKWKNDNPELVKAVEQSLPTQEQTPTQKMDEAIAELKRAWKASGYGFNKNAGQNLGFMYDPKVDIKRQGDLFKALYNVAKLAIEQAATKLKNITAKDFIAFIRKDGKAFGNITDAHLTDVFNEANKPPLPELDWDIQDQDVKEAIITNAQNLIESEEFKDYKEFSLRLKELYGLKESDAKTIYDSLVDHINAQTEDLFSIALRGKGAVTDHMNNKTLNESSEDELGNRTYLANSFNEMNEDIDAVFNRIRAANPKNWEKIIADKILEKLDARDMQAAIFADRFVTFINNYLTDHQRSPNYTEKAREYKKYRIEILRRRQKFTQEYATYFAKLQQLKLHNPLTLLTEHGLLDAAEMKAAKEMDEKLKGKKEYDASGKPKPFVEDSKLDKAPPTSDKETKKASKSEVKKNVLNALKNAKNNAADLAIKITKIPC